MKIDQVDDTFYPDDDGEPMSDNTLQAEWIHLLFGNLDALFRDDDDIFVASNHLIYPIKGDNTTRMAPDVYVAFGRPKHHRGSYKVWEENGIFPQVTFEILSPSNRAGEMNRKREFYERFGVQEYYIYDPDENLLQIYLRSEQGKLELVPEPRQFVSPLLGIYFDWSDGLTVSLPTGDRFLTFRELAEQASESQVLAESERRRADTLSRRADTLSRRAQYETQRAEELLSQRTELQQRLEAEMSRAAAAAEQAAQEAARAAKLLAALRAAGIDPDTV